MKKSALLFLFFFGLVAFSSAQVYLFDNTLLSGTSLQTNAAGRVSCSVVSSGGVDGGPSIFIKAINGVLPGDNCYIKFNGTTPNLSGYNEIEFFIKSNPINVDHGYAGFYLQDSTPKTAGPNIVVPKEYTRYRFPLKNTFSALDLTHIISPFYLDLHFVQGESLTVDNIVLHNRNNFELFTDSTSNGPAALTSWGDASCSVQTRESAPEGSQVLVVPSNAWGCGLFFNGPPLDLSAFNTVEFMLRSSTPSLIEIESGSGKTGVQVPSTNNNWTPVTLLLSQFGLNLSQTTGAFSITKVGTNTAETLVDRVRYFV